MCIYIHTLFRYVVLPYTLRVLYIIASWGSTWLSDSYGKGFVRTRGAGGEVANVVSTIFYVPTLTY